MVRCNTECPPCRSCQCVIRANAGGAARPVRPAALSLAVEEIEEAPLQGPVPAIGPVRLEIVRETTVAAQWDALVARWHSDRAGGDSGH